MTLFTMFVIIVSAVSYLLGHHRGRKGVAMEIRISEPDGSWRHGRIDPISLGAVVKKIQRDEKRNRTVRAKFDEESG